MTPDEINQAVEEYLYSLKKAQEGWIPWQRDDREKLFGGGYSFGLWIFKDRNGDLKSMNFETKEQLEKYVPDARNFCGDLNACHEMENIITSDGETGYKYDMFLYMITGAFDQGSGNVNFMKLWHATARQRAEAFLKTVGKWRE